MAAGPRIREGEAHLFLIDPASVDPRDAARLLCEQERAQRDRLRFPTMRHRYAVAHAVLRRSLSWCMPDVTPDQWRYGKGPYGRPEVAGPVCEPAIRFSLSHVRDGIACLVTLRHACGIDLSPLREPIDLPVIAARVLTDVEHRTLSTLPAELQHAHFHRLWSLKEAYLKARGTGLRHPPHQVGFDLSRPEPQLASEPVVVDARRFRFWQRFSRGAELVAADRADHALAIALHGWDRGDPTVTIHNRRDIDP